MQKTMIHMESHDGIELYVYEGHTDVFLHAFDDLDGSNASVKMTPVEAEFLIEQLKENVKVARANAERVQQ